jgi:hypothetical protein
LPNRRHGQPLSEGIYRLIDMAPTPIQPLGSAVSLRSWAHAIHDCRHSFQKFPELARLPPCCVLGSQRLGPHILDVLDFSQPLGILPDSLAFERGQSLGLPPRVLTVGMSLHSME